MPKGSHQKLKLYYLSRIMTQKTDDEHFLTMPEIQRELSEYGVSADRKSLYDDMESLRVLGIDVIGEKVGKNSRMCWIFALGDKVKITGPKSVVERFGEEIKNISRYYSGG